jgi:hypothetical protein
MLMPIYPLNRIIRPKIRLAATAPIDRRRPSR